MTKFRCANAILSRTAPTQKNLVKRPLAKLSGTQVHARAHVQGPLARELDTVRFEFAANPVWWVQGPPGPPARTPNSRVSDTLELRASFRSAFPSDSAGSRPRERWGNSQKLRVSDTLSFWDFPGRSRGVEPECSPFPTVFSRDVPARLGAGPRLLD